VLTTSLTLLDLLRDTTDKEARDRAWDRFVRLYQPFLRTWARRQGFHDADAEDLTQEVLLKLFQLLPTYQRAAGQSFRGWLHKVTANQCVDFRRRKATRPLPAADGLSGVDQPAAIEVEEAEYRQLLARRAMELIRPDFNEQTWSAFTGVRVEGRPTREVATQLGLSENAVYLACHRVMTRLREELGGFLD
jgi:RNA polymerase sigma-70 factor (ECF subfamily)